MAKRFSNKAEAMEFLSTLPMNSIMEYAAEFLVGNGDRNSQKIPITKEAFSAHFRIIGMTESGEPETRGRKRKE